MVQQYNELVAQQRDLTSTIHASLNTIVSALEKKLQLAEEQKQLQATIGIAYPELSVADVRRQVIDVIVRRLEQRDITQLPDWTTRFAGLGGNLDE
jgi:cobalamin biosynthesis Mg chelatase CobN